MCGTCGCTDTPALPESHVPAPLHRRLTPGVSLLTQNDRQAQTNREWFDARRLLTLNLVSSPGSGKTTLLEATARHWSPRERSFCVIEGDQHTQRDAERIRAAGAHAVQINTGKLCHLEATHVHAALPALAARQDGLVVIENVGNLICPMHFDLGEHLRVTLLSVTEGEDKPLKYPDSLLGADLLLITKTDLLPYVPFDLQAAREHARAINPDLEILQVNTQTGDGILPWLAWLDRQWQTYASDTHSGSAMSRNDPPSDRRY
jgi:hydrogenase nickel incorporation protein HypB